MFLTCGWLYGKGKKILQQAAGKLRSQAFGKGARAGRGETFKSFKNRSGAKKDCWRQPEGWSEASSIKF